MTSNDDPTGEKTAFKQILACTLSNTAIPVVMAVQGSLNPVFVAPFLLSQANALRAVYRFKNEKGSAAAAKNLKRASYPPFMVLLIGFVGTTAYTKFNRRRDSDEQEWSV